PADPALPGREGPLETAGLIRTKALPGLIVGPFRSNKGPKPTPARSASEEGCLLRSHLGLVSQHCSCVLTANPYSQVNSGQRPALPVAVWWLRASGTDGRESRISSRSFRDRRRGLASAPGVGPQQATGGQCDIGPLWPAAQTLPAGGVAPVPGHRGPPR